MRHHGRAATDPTNPRALAVCDFCGFRYNLKDLRWEHDWRGPRIQNLRFLVCDTCLDKPQPNGQKTYILPPDPIPVMNARPEMYVPDDNPLSALGAAPSPLPWQYGNQIGNMTNYAGVPAAFDGNLHKPLGQCAVISVSNSSYNNYIGINWTGNTFSLSAPSSLQYPDVTHSVTGFTLIAPNDSTFGSTSFVIQGSPVASAPWGAWTTIYSGSPAGTIGESINGATTGGRFRFHRCAFLGGGQQIAVAQLTLTTGEIG